MDEIRLMNRPSGGEFDGTPFLGEVPAMIPNSSIAAACGIAGGTLINEGQPWLKFDYKGKTLYVPKKAIRHSITWINLYEAAAVHGTDTNDVKMANAYATIQNRKTTIAGKQYRIRLLSGAGSNPYLGSQTGDATALNPCEWNDLFYPILADPGITSYTGPKIRKPYTPVDLGISNTNAYQCLTRNIVNATAAGTVLTRGSTTSMVPATSGNAGNSVFPAVGWRPCLELIP